MANDKQKSKSGFSATKAGGYAAQKRYRTNHPDRVREQNQKQRGKTYEPKVRIPIEHKATIDELLKATGLSFTQLCIAAIEEKYGITLHSSLDITGDE